MLVCVKDTFSAAHKLPEHPKCGRKHGHNYTVIVKVKIDVDVLDLKEQIKVDFAALKTHLRTILNKLDHTDLNETISYPTAENIAKWIYKKLHTILDVEKVVVYETDKYWVELKP